MQSVVRWVASGIVVSVLPLVAAQQPASPPASPSPSAANAQGPRPGEPPAEQGIPVTDAEVQKACGSCHTADDKNLMTRISFAARLLKTGSSRFGG